MPFYTTQHQTYCGIDLHARTMSVCILNQAGDILVPQNMQSSPDALLRTIAPYRDDIVVAVECVFTWYWLADLGAREGIPFVLGHALSMQAIHGGKATNDTINAHKIAVLLRGGMLPQAAVSPAAMRATRDLLRRRLSLTRKRAELWAHIQHTNSQSNLPEIGKKLAYQANRDGVAERFPAPAVHKSLAVDLALLGYDEPLLRDLALPIVKAAQQHDAHTLSLLQTGPGIGKMLSLVLLYEIHAIQRFPSRAFRKFVTSYFRLCSTPMVAVRRAYRCRMAKLTWYGLTKRCTSVQDVVSSCRLVTCAKESAGTRSGTAGAKIGKTYLTWALSEAAVLLLRDNPAGQKSLTRLEKKHGQGKALTLLAQKLGRAVSDL